MRQRKDCLSAGSQKASPLRKQYIVRLICRIVIFAASAFLLIRDPEQAGILKGWNFFQRLSPFHLLWLVWVFDMLWQLVPVKNSLPLGSQKLFRLRFRPIKQAVNYQALRRHIIDTTKAAYKVFFIWFLAIAALCLLRYFRVLTDVALFLITVGCYVCDLICVLIWCPFRLIMKNRCCTTCRIFNWDHLMMFTPMLLLRGFYSQSLILMSIAVWLVWELCIMMYPERFWEQSNEALTCANCTDKLCTQYCRKLRPSDPSPQA